MSIWDFIDKHGVTGIIGIGMVCVIAGWSVRLALDGIAEALRLRDHDFED